jgi:tetrahydromethanopterin S-methyltransferase subunit H
MFTFDKEQKVFQIGTARVGGQPGVNPPLIIPSLFQKGDPCVESRRERTFNKTLATEQIRRLEELSELTGMPAIVAMVANSGDEMKGYVDFYVETTDMPFAIDMWNLDPRIEATRYVAELGLQDRLLYNSVTVWSPDVPAEVEVIRDLGIKHVVTVVMDMANQLPSGRISSLDDMMQKLAPGNFESIIVDTSVMNLPSTGICALSNRLVKEKYGLPAGAASANGSYMWQKAMWKDKKETWRVGLHRARRRHPCSHHRAVGRLHLQRPDVGQRPRLPGGGRGARHGLDHELRRDRHADQQRIGAGVQAVPRLRQDAEGRSVTSRRTATVGTKR